jgi:MoaA/NifB/PqqE/SkfB family radical SAM enzyme
MKVFLHATYDCNANCKHCAVPKRKEYLDLELFRQIIDKIQTDYLIIGGGEPLMHPELNQMIDYAYDKTKLKIETNGKLLSKEFLELNRKKIFQLNISIDGSENTHNMIRGIDTFQHTVKMIKEARTLDIDVAIWSVIMNKNVSELETVVNLTKKLGVKKLSFLYATPVGKCDISMTVSPLTYFSVVENIKKMEDKSLQIRIAPFVLPKNTKINNLGCLINDHEIIHVDPSGDIYPCVLLLDNPKYKLGSVASYKEISVADPSLCIGLTESLGKDNRKKYGTPVCPCKTISKEWKY